MNFAKKLFLGSVIAMGAFGLVACGSDSSSSASDNNSKVDIDPSNNAANITFEDAGSRVAGDTLRFTGRYKLDFVDATNENSASLTFKTINFEVMNSAQEKVNALVLTNPEFVPSANEINLNSMYSIFVRIVLTDPAFVACDDYSLVVKVIATDGVNEYPRTDVIPFDVEAKTDFFCKNAEPESSSSEPISNEVVMTPCEVQISTANNEGVSIATCTAVPAATADIAFAKSGSRSEPDVTASAGAGITFLTLTNEDYGNGMWPEDVNNRPAYLSDFRMGTIEKTSLESLIGNGEGLSYVAKTATADAATGAGIYPFAVYDSGFPDKNGYYTFKVKIYKVQ